MKSISVLSSSTSAALAHNERSALSASARADALLGANPTCIFWSHPQSSDEGSCCSIGLVRASSGVWLGLVRDRSDFADWVRLGQKPDYVSGLVRGVAHVRLLGAVSANAAVSSSLITDLIADLPAAWQAAATLLVRRYHFSLADLLLVAVEPETAILDDGAGSILGAVPRT